MARRSEIVLEPLGSWSERSLCTKVGPEDFFATENDAGGRAAVARAKAVCARCPVREECLEYALGYLRLDGIWGGMTPRERWKERKRRRGLRNTLM